MACCNLLDRLQIGINSCDVEKFDKSVFRCKATAGVIIEPQNTYRMLLNVVNKRLLCVIEFAAETGEATHGILI